MASFAIHNGDSAELDVSLTWSGSPFEPGDDWALIFSAKYDLEDADENAVIQKASGAGIVVDESTATVSLLPADTEDLRECRLVCDVRATHITNGTRRTVARFELLLGFPVTREGSTSIPVITDGPPLPFARVATEIHAAEEKEAPSGDDEFGIADSEDDFVIKKLTWANIRASMAAHFDPIYSPIEHSHTFADIEGTPTTIAGYGIADAVSSSQLSTSGGASKVLQMDSSGNLVTGAYANGANGTALSHPGNVKIPDQQGVQWMNPSTGLITASIRHWSGHDAFGGEMVYTSPWRMAFACSGPVQFGGNATLRDSQSLYLSSGSATSTDTLRESKALILQSGTWTAGAAAGAFFGMQAVPLDTTGTNNVLKVKSNASVVGFTGGSIIPTTGRLDGTDVAEFSNTGFWHAGATPATDLLADGATITHTVSKYRPVQVASVTLAGDRTLVISGTLTGMRGVIYVKQDATGTRLLTLPAGSATTSSWALSTAANTIDRLQWEFDGTYYFWTISKGITLPVDTDAAAFIAAGSITDDTQETAINELTLALKGSNVSGTGTLWSKLFAIYPFVGGNATAHSKDLKGAHNGTFGGSPTHDANGITGNATNAYFDTGFAPTAFGSLTSQFIYVYNRTATPTNAGRLMGSQDGSSYRSSLNFESTSLRIDGLNRANYATVLLAHNNDARGHISATIVGGLNQTLSLNGTSQTSAVTATGRSTLTFRVLCDNYNNTVDSPTNANIAFNAYGESLDATERAAFRAIVDAFQTALGRKV